MLNGVHHLYIYVLDASSSEPDLSTQLHTLHNELECYQKEMSDHNDVT